jgi:hypothetical protein
MCGGIWGNGQRTTEILPHPIEPARLPLPASPPPAAAPSPQTQLHNTRCKRRDKPATSPTRLCRIPCLWQYARPLTSWYIRFLTVPRGTGYAGPLPPRSIHFFRSVDRYSNTCGARRTCVHGGGGVMVGDGAVGWEERGGGTPEDKHACA